MGGGKKWGIPRDQRKTRHSKRRARALSFASERAPRREDAVKMSSSSSLLASFRALRASSSSSSVRMMRSRCFSSRAGDDDDGDDDAKGKDVDVVIVGGGPTGVVLRSMLSSFNVQKSVVVERHARASTHPKAHFMNRRTMEIFRDQNAFDSMRARVREKMSKEKNWRHFRYVTGILDENEELGSVDHFSEERMEVGEKSASMEGVVHFPQHKLMPLLWENVQKKATTTMDDDNGDDDVFVRGDEVVRIDRVNSHNQASTSNGSNNRCRVTLKSGKVFEAKYVVACDGASSFVATKLNGHRKPNENKSFPTQTLGNIHFVSRSLAKRIEEKGNEAMLYFVFNKDIVGVVVAHDLCKGEFALQLPYHAPIQNFKEMFTKKNCEMYVRNAISGGYENGAVVDDIEVLDVKSWTMDATVADVVVDEKRAPRIVLAGDAMHAFPPAGGFGMNTGIQDAHNLAWKLAIAVQNDQDHDVTSALLNSYAYERKKIALENKQLSTDNYERVLEIPRALGLEPRALDALVLASNALPVPQVLKSFAFEKILSAGRMQTVLLESDRKNPLGKYRREAVKKLCGTSGETLKLKFLNEELGFSYAEGAKATNPNVLAVGKRIPHCAILNDEGDGIISTIDLGGSNSKSECRFFALVSSRVTIDKVVVEEAQKMLPKGASLKLARILSSSKDKAEKKKGNVDIYVDQSSNNAWTSILNEYTSKKKTKQVEVILCRPDAHVAFIGAFGHLPSAVHEAARGNLVL